VARKPTEYVQFKLRIRESFRLQIKAAAEKKKHSANIEAVERLERSLKRDEDSDLIQRASAAIVEDMRRILALTEERKAKNEKMRLQMEKELEHALVPVDPATAAYIRALFAHWTALPREEPNSK